MTVIPIACRFVSYDQWFVSHFDDTAKIKHVKLWCLSKCNLVQSPGPPPHRSVSPIVFASTARARSSIDTLDDGYSEDDEHSDHDISSKPTLFPHSGPSKQPQSSPLVDHYTLLSFSTGSILEDEFSLSWYNLRPYELLEMHPVRFVAPLQRDVLAEYIQPYFQARVRVLRSVWNNKSGRFEPPGIDTTLKTMDRLAHRFDSLSTKSTLEKNRKTKVEWKARWVVIHQGMLYLCKDHVTNPPTQHYPLSSMTALRGADALERAFAIIAHRVVSIKFRPHSPPHVASPPPSLPSSPISEQLKINAQEPVQTTDPGQRSQDPSKEQGDWIVLDMLDDHAFSSILRILHRHAPYPISSSFVPASSIFTVSSIPSPATSSFSSYDTVPYPEWRVHTIENARKAGMGDVGKAMAWVLWSEKGLGETLLGNIRHHRHAFTQEMRYKVALPPDMYRGLDDESDEESEMEWEGWMRDLERQSRVKQQSEKASKPTASAGQMHVASSTSLPSPPLSEASPSGSPRVRSPSLSVSAHTQYPNIGNVIQAGGSRGHRSTEPHSPENLKSTTVSTVSVGMTPFPRQRSSTLLAEMGALTKRDSDKGREPFPNNGARSGARTISISASLHSPSSSLRHVRSSSNLRVSSSPYGSDAAESVGYAGPSSPRRQNAFIRGMSLRAGKLVRGLESAIDFVDENT